MFLKTPLLIPSVTDATYAFFFLLLGATKPFCYPNHLVLQTFSRHHHYTSIHTDTHLKYPFCKCFKIRTIPNHHIHDLHRLTPYFRPCLYAYGRPVSHHYNRCTTHIYRTGQGFLSCFHQPSGILF